MPTSTANATWEGTLREGQGTYAGTSGFTGSYSFPTRFGDAKGSNPEELLAAAESACFSMALSANLEKAGATPQRVQTTARCTVEPKDGGMKITTMVLDVRASASGLDAARFREIVEETKRTCPVSSALSGVEISIASAELT